MEASNICHQGIIKEISGNTLKIQIERQTACAACHAKNVCMASNRKNELIHIASNESENYQIGEIVQVFMKQSMGGKAVVFAYLFPFFVLVLGLFVTYYCTKNELLSVCIAFAAITLYYLLIKKFENKLKKVFSFFVSKINN